MEPSLLVWDRVRQLRRVSLRSSQDQGSRDLFVCYFVFDWWEVSTAIQIRLYAGLLSVLPLKVCGMSLHVHGAVTENG